MAGWGGGGPLGLCTGWPQRTGRPSTAPNQRISLCSSELGGCTGGSRNRVGRPWGTPSHSCVPFSRFHRLNECLSLILFKEKGFSVKVCKGLTWMPLKVQETQDAGWLAFPLDTGVAAWQELSTGLGDRGTPAAGWVTCPWCLGPLAKHRPVPKVSLSLRAGAAGTQHPELQAMTPSLPIGGTPAQSTRQWRGSTVSSLQKTRSISTPEPQRSGVAFTTVAPRWRNPWGPRLPASSKVPEGP